MFAFLYNISIWLYTKAIHIASVKNEKASKWVEGRKDWENKLSEAVKSYNKPIWIHCASLGEFEQGRPLIEAIKNRFPERKVVLTFFSPSGYEIRKNYSLADYVCYLPSDSPQNAKLFIDILNPSIAIFIKYEFWLNFIRILNIRNIPLFIVSAIFRKEQHFFKWYGGLFRRHLSQITFIGVQNRESKLLLDAINIKATVTGDTRFDRVSKLADSEVKNEIISNFKGSDILLVAGSTWEPDEEIISNYIQSAPGQVKIVIAPHETDRENIKRLVKQLKVKALLYSEITGGSKENSNVLIIDNIGLLSGLYFYADITYIGGGFGKGIHNILEPAAFGKPVLFGPNYHKFQEANDLISKGSAISVKGLEDFKFAMNKLVNDEDNRLLLGNMNSVYVKTNVGATELIMKEVINKLQ